MSMLLLSEEDVRAAIDVPTAIAVLERAFREWAAGQADNVPRQRARAPGIVLHQMSAACPFEGVVGWKAYTTSRSGARFHVALYDSETGAPRALLEADWLGRIRTGAATGLAARWLAPRDADSVAIIGCGRQAATQLEAVAAVRAIREAWVYCRRAEKRESFAGEMSQRLGVPVHPATSAQEAVSGRPIVVTVTTAREPVMEDGWLSPGALVCAVGSNWPQKREVPPETVLRAAPVVCDDVAACRHEAGELLAAAELGWNWESAINLRDVVAGHAAPAAWQHRDSPLRMFKSVGLALEDVALAAEVVRRAAPGSGGPKSRIFSA